MFSESYKDLDQEIINEIIQLFLVEYPISIEQIETAIQEKDSAHLSQYAHKYKGTVSAMFDAELRDVVYKLEQIGKSGSVERTEELVEKMKQQSLELAFSLKEIMD